MKTPTWVVLFAALALHARADAPAFIEQLAVKAAHAEASDVSVVRGEDGWLFFAPELRSMGVGRFWSDAAADVSRAPKPEYADPLPAILDFHAQLDGAGIELIFVPVPAKAVIYPDAIADGVDVDDGEIPRLDAYHQEFYAVLRERGVRVLDLAPVYLEHRRAANTDLYCRQDTHWSGQGLRIAADEIARVIRDGGWVNDTRTHEYDAGALDTRITGDLWTQLGDAGLEKESLRLLRVGPTAAAPQTWTNNEWRESPVLLLGDSHCLVFHEGGDMHARGAGLPDHLAARLGFPTDVVGVRGSGATPSRLALFRRRDSLKGKRVVVWCLSVREFTEGQGWREVPVIR
ncbi:hypothetical protein HN371_17505 [Candidatus Poribacteria bacterium]|nr:hypothetical protein [Candidatus Poribacteria bacterium]MBT5533310.1 hypothetical protein [Candidatus Poribacteria bacterium]MBT5712479.1 hypothetical protein [Candidatus Poribacteria bacterium]MBT7807906.1 hypothetical protein [Candidatus Poribacteria bacterium]